MIDVNTEELEEQMEQATEDERLAKVKEIFPQFKITASKIGQVKSEIGTANKYKVTIKNGDAQANFTFTDSVYNTRKGIKSHKFNMFYCIVQDANCYQSTSSKEDFANEFGYDMYEDSAKLNRAYKGCERAYDKLYEMFDGDDGLYTLNAICYQY
jgi:hypothetical protein